MFDEYLKKDFTNAKHMEESYNIIEALHRKLHSKNEALKIMREELEKYRTERDQFKLMAETLQMRYSAIKRNTDCSNLGIQGNPGVITLLNETREKNCKLTTEVGTLRERLTELQGDIMLLREKSNSTVKLNSKFHEELDHASSNEGAKWKNEKMDFINKLEILKKKNAQLSFDLKSMLDEKEEAVHDRDAYKCKIHRLNHELSIALKADESNPKILDIDSLILENKYLQDKLNVCESELESTKQSVDKLKTMIDKKNKKGILKLGSSDFIDNSISPSKINAILANPELQLKGETIEELCLSMLDNLNDKSLALNHQKKTNKILANQISTLENRLQQFTNFKEGEALTNFSPSQILLNGYKSANVDEKIQSENTEDSGTISDESNKISITSQNLHNDDELDSLSGTRTTNSNTSLYSSEYDNDYLESNKMKNIDFNHLDACQKERLNDLKELPSVIADLVLRNLELNSQDDNNELGIE